jgi:Zn finger protein HypA/HybF involved in hydrogenase expression
MKLVRVFCRKCARNWEEPKVTAGRKPCPYCGAGRTHVPKP